MPSTVLVVDDDSDLVRLVSRYLTLEGFAPVPAANGREALKYLQGGGAASVILLDLRMPIMDGWTFRREQRADPAIASIPVVVLSGIADVEGLQELGVAAAFNKPVSFPEVIGVVRKLANAAV
ncbi:MAG TPA: response regulator [Vicinamibacterales bacterium]|jgi:CheY-like chemotaxis protein|nr:response regulator [Vicinamibacterales bacterium]